jgi:hypothetical protein
MLIEPISAQQVTKFKGFFIGMNRSEVVALKPPDYKLKESAKTIGFVGPNALLGSPDALFVLDQTGVVNEMVLNKDFFNAMNMPGDQFVRAIVVNYGLQQLSCETGRSVSKGMGGMPENVSSTRCKGYSGNGELIDLSDSVLSVKRMSDRPSFN